MRYHCTLCDKEVARQLEHVVSGGGGVRAALFHPLPTYSIQFFISDSLYMYI